MHNLRLILLHLSIISCFTASFQMRPVSLLAKQSTVKRMMSDNISDSNMQVTVVGGTGLTGSRVVKSLAEKGISVTSVSKSGNIPDWCRDEPWVGNVSWKACDLLEEKDATLDDAIGRPSAIVSCVGAIGTDIDILMKGNGQANVAAFNSAKRGGKLQRSVFVSVSSEVVACKENWLPKFFAGYFDGKLIGEQAALDAVDGENDRLCLVKPTFIYGGPSFGLLPPRVNAEYGSFIEELLSLPIIKILADVTPGLIKVALRPPSSVDAVAAACAAAALGEKGVIGEILDGTADINKATDQPSAKGLTNAIDWSKEKGMETIEWSKVEFPKAVSWCQAKLEEAQKSK